MERLFVTEKWKGRVAYRFYAIWMIIGICLVLWYRVSHVPTGRGRVAWIGLFCAELWYAFYWIVTQSVRWSPARQHTFIDRLSDRYEDKQLPGVDIFVCTADPYAEPPSIVISTILSVMAYNYPPEKLNIYLSDDGGSILTFYALWEASQFAKHWIPYCKKYKVEPRSPAVYFSRSRPNDLSNPREWSFMKDLYEEMTNSIDSAVMSGKIPEEIRVNHKGFCEWNSEVTSRNHHPIVQVLIDGKTQNAVDSDGNVLPTLVYVAREKRPQHHHNFKAGAMNALIRVSAVISNSPIILNVDCDMYSHNAESIKHALCFFLDEEMGHNIGFVQYPQKFYNMTKNDIYDNSFNVLSNVELPGFDTWAGVPYIGTGCFHRREILCGRRFTQNYNEDWNRGVRRKTGESVQEIEENAKLFATCTYEHNTQWGNEVGLKYGCSVEDVMTGFLIQCRGWKSALCSPARAGFLGLAPTTLAQTILQQKRWSEGDLTIFLSKYCFFLFGLGKIKLGHQMAYSIYGLWALNSFPTLYYVAIPTLSLLKGIPLFPKMTSPWFIPFAYVAIARNVYSLAESVGSGDTFKGWWNGQRMWIIRRITSYLFATIDTLLKLLGMSNMTFQITGKVCAEDESKRYEQEIMEFGSSSPAFVVIAAIALLNLLCLWGGLNRLIIGGWSMGLETFFLQVVLCGLLVAINIPVYDAMFFRKDKGSLPFSVTLISIGFVMLAFLIPIV